MSLFCTDIKLILFSHSYDYIGPTNDSILAVLAIPTVLPPTVIILIIIIVVLVVRMHLQSGVYRPQHAENQRRKRIAMDHLAEKEQTRAKIKGYI